MSERVLRPNFSQNSSKLPRHVAIIMDGNGRWAKRRHLPRVAGHKAGVESVRKIVRACGEKGIEVLTLFAFSSENWQRPKEEVDTLMHLFITALRHEVNKLHKNNVQLRIIGNRERLSTDLRQAMEQAEKLTVSNTGLKLVVAVDYGGHWDIANAARQLAAEVLNGAVKLEDINADVLAKFLSTDGLPAPDLFIRPSGEQRISNFLLWQLAYTELYFTETHWPDFDVPELEKALEFYAQRERRFGGLVAPSLPVEDMAHA